MKRKRASSGFTLIELMVVVAIIGILSSVAMPSYQRMTLRAKRAERDTIVESIGRAVQGKLVQDGKFPVVPVYAGDWNPAGEPSTTKRRFDFRAVNWKDLDLQLEGDVFYRYYFYGDQPVNAPMTLTVMAEGDLDGDLVKSVRTLTYEITEGSLLVKVDTFETEGVF